MLRVAPAILVATLIGAGGCGKSEAPKVDAAAEREAAQKRAREDVFGAQVKAVEQAKGLQEDLNRKATESVDRIEKDAK